MVRTAFVLTLLLAFGASSDAWAGTEVRVAHLSPDAGPVDVYVDGVKVLSGVEFPGISPYLTLASGTVSVEVTPAGSTDAVIAADLEFEDGISYTVGATGLVADDDLSAIVLEDNRNAVEGETQVRVIHTSPDAPAVDVVVRGGNPLFENLSFRESSDYAVVAAATYDLDVTLTGTATVALPLDGVTLESGTNYDVFAIGLVDNETLTVTVAVTDQFAAQPAAVDAAVEDHAFEGGKHQQSVAPEEDAARVGRSPGVRGRRRVLPSGRRLGGRGGTGHAATPRCPGRGPARRCRRCPACTRRRGSAGSSGPRPSGRP